MQWRGKPQRNRCDNGPESISAQLHSGAKEQKIDVIHTQAGQPQPNAYIERDHRTVRDAWLASPLFESIEQVEEEAIRWLWTDNHQRPHRLRTRSLESKNNRSGNTDGREKGLSTAVIAHRNAPPIVQTPKHIFHLVPLFIQSDSVYCWITAFGTCQDTPADFAFC